MIQGLLNLVWLYIFEMGDGVFTKSVRAAKSSVGAALLLEPRRPRMGSDLAALEDLPADALVPAVRARARPAQRVPAPRLRGANHH
jgi:hypothetical protein